MNMVNPALFCKDLSFLSLKEYAYAHMQHRMIFTCIFYVKTKLDPVLKMLSFKLFRSRVHITTEQAHNPPQILAQTPLSNLTIKQKTYRHFGALNMGERNQKPEHLSQFTRRDFKNNTNLSVPLSLTDSITSD